MNDTNMIAALIKALVDQKSAVATGTGPNSLLIAGMFVAAMTPTLAAIAAYFKAAAAVKNSEESKRSNADTAVSVEKIHVAVNSERSQALTTIQNLRDEVLRVSKELAEAKGQKQEKAIQEASTASAK